MNVTVAQIRGQYKSLTWGKRRALRRAAARSSHVDYPLLCAIASRETNMHNIVGDGGHGRGMFQQDDRYQKSFLSSTPGCRSGSSVPIYTSAFPKGRVPTVSAGAKRCVDMIEAAVRYATTHDIPEGHRLKFAISAYNAGEGGAMQGWREHRNPDARTAGGNYAADVLQRAAVLRST